MTTAIRRLIPLFALMAFISIGAPIVRAACPNITINNLTTCTVNITFYNAVPQTFTIIGVVPGLGVYPGSPGFMPVGVVTFSGAYVPSVNGCTPCVQLPISSTAYCCATVCSGANCTLTINPVVPCNSTCQ
ncbi:MAG: hypothetical protein ABIQ57_04585 [Candidatus Kapaibacterium sp.]